MILDFVKFSLWPIIKVRVMYFWWIIKYRGKKNIPPELIFRQMAKNMESVAENVLNAVRVSPENVSKEEQEMLRGVLMKVSKFKSEIKNLKN